MNTWTKRPDECLSEDIFASSLGVYSGITSTLYAENADWGFIDLPDELKSDMTSRMVWPSPLHAVGASA